MIGSFSHWQPRPGTMDAQIIDHVYTRNCYGLPDDMRDYVVVDVGAHVGAFTIACLDRGARVLAFEADEENYRLAWTHLNEYCQPDRVRLYHHAVTAALQDHVRDLSGPYPQSSHATNTGGKNIFVSGDARLSSAVRAVSLRDVVSTWLEAPFAWGVLPVSGKLLLKLDCEGAEHQILADEYMEPLWGRFDYIIGEAHDATGLDPAFPPDQLLNAQAVLRRLSQLGYKVRYKNALPKGLAIFSAARRNPLSLPIPGNPLTRPCPCGNALTEQHMGWCDRGREMARAAGKVRILWVGDAVASTGFSRCTHSACDALHAAGYDVHVLGMNYYGDPGHGYPYPIYPARKGGDWSGVLRLPELVERLDPDLIIGLNDAWNVRDYLDELNDSGVQLPPILFWLAADAQNQAAGRELDDLTHVVAWTQFGVDEFRKGGYRGPASIVPLGVDTTLFRPLDRQECRAKVLPASVPPDAFIVGFVGRNQPRKRIDLLLRYFAAWRDGQATETCKHCGRVADLHSMPENHCQEVVGGLIFHSTTRVYEPQKPRDGYLYLHVAPTGETGTDIRSLTRYYGLEGRVIVSHPPIGEGVADSVLPYVYGAMDLFLTTTQGEGWGLPVIEALACGTLCAVPDWSALGEWARSAAYMIPCTSTALSAPLNGKAYTIGGVPDERGTVDAIQWAYERVTGKEPESSYERYTEAGLELAHSLSWEKTGEGMVREVERLLGVTR